MEHKTPLAMDDMIPMPAPIPAGLVAPTPEALLVEGGVATGKTQALVERAAHLIEGGADAGTLVVLCATPDAAQRFKARLVQACPAAAGVRATTARQWCLEALARPEVAAATGRSARLLAPFEVDVLMEDMKTGGMRPQRLREMLRFFYKSLSELCDWEEEDWLLTGEEKMTWELLQGCLGTTGAILDAELVNTVARHLHDDPAAAARLGYAHVLVDDYQMLSRASQVLANKLAQASVTVAANPPLCVEVFDAYPYAAGIEEFLAANPQAARRTLDASFACTAAIQAANGVAERCAQLDAPLLAAGAGCTASTLVELGGHTPALERDAVARAVQEALEGGMHPGDVTVVAPNGVWSRNVAAALRERGIATASPCSPKAVSGDLRELDRCVAARLLTALYLVADPADGAAWRSWCGFGDHFAASSAMASVRAWALEQGVSLAQALDRHAQIARDSGVNRAEHAHVEGALTAARELFAATQGLHGDDLLLCLAALACGEGASVPPELRALTAPLADGSLDGDDATSMAARARARLAAPHVDALDAVQVVSFKDTVGATPRMVVLCGFVNGFFPVRGVVDREVFTQEAADKQIAKDARYLAGAAGKPLECLVVSTFDEVGLEVAERMKMKIRRVQLEEGRRVALTQPSVYLDLIKG